MAKNVARLIWTLGMLIVVSCSRSKPAPEVIDLDKVLTIFAKVADAPVEATEASDGAEASDGVGVDGDVEPVEKDDGSKAGAFRAKFAQELNKAKLVLSPIGVDLRGDGALEGFKDPNKNMKKESGETTYFTIEIDKERKRLIASNTVAGDTYRRDRAYRPRGGMLSGFILGSMLFRQNSYYGGSRARPTYGNMRMNPRGYHGGAVSRVRAKSSSGGRARSGGSRGFRGGK